MLSSIEASIEGMSLSALKRTVVYFSINFLIFMHISVFIVNLKITQLWTELN